MLFINNNGLTPVSYTHLDVYKRQTGGRALKFYSSIRMDVRRVETLKQGGEMVGNHTRIKVVKNKVAPPFKQAEFDIMFGTGISKEGDILDLAAECGIVNKSGAWYAYNGDKIGQGRENAKIFLKEHTDICDEIEKQVRIHYHLLPDEEGQAKEPVPATDVYKRQATGGIVQGLSGSPVIQNGKIIGAVTHVFVQDASSGYGIFIENMLKNTERLF